MPKSEKDANLVHCTLSTFFSFFHVCPFVKKRKDERGMSTPQLAFFSFLSSVLTENKKQKERVCVCVLNSCSRILLWRLHKCSSVSVSCFFFSFSPVSRWIIKSAFGKETVCLILTTTKNSFSSIYFFIFSFFNVQKFLFFFQTTTRKARRHASVEKENKSIFPCTRSGSKSGQEEKKREATTYCLGPRHVSTERNLDWIRRERKRSLLDIPSDIHGSLTCHRKARPISTV